MDGETLKEHIGEGTEACVLILRYQILWEMFSYFFFFEIPWHLVLPLLDILRGDWHKKISKIVKFPQNFMSKELIILFGSTNEYATYNTS